MLGQKRQKMVEYGNACVDSSPAGAVDVDTCLQPAFLPRIADGRHPFEPGYRSLIGLPLSRAAALPTRRSPDSLRRPLNPADPCAQPSTLSVRAPSASLAMPTKRSPE